MQFLPFIHYYFLFCNFFFCFCVVLVGFCLFFIGIFFTFVFFYFFLQFLLSFFSLLRVSQLKTCAHKRKINHYWRTNFRAFICYKGIKADEHNWQSTSFFRNNYFFGTFFFTYSLSSSMGPSGWPHRDMEPAGLGNPGCLQSLYQGLTCPCLPAGTH